MCCVASLPAAERSSDDATPEPADSSESSEPPQAAEPADSTEPGPCERIDLHGKAWIDWLQHRVHVSVCESALWFDQLFGGRTAYEERDQNHGWLRVGAAWDERDGTEPLARGRASFYLPRMEHRLRAIVGRDDSEELISEHSRDDDQVANLFDDPGDDEWLVGLGYGRPGSGRDRFDYGIGARVSTPIEPYAKVSYRHYHLYSDALLGRLRQTVFWESEDGLGTTSRYDLERFISTDRLLRWRTAATLAEGSEGVRWSSGVSLYQRVGVKRAIAYETVARGETDHEVPMREVRFRLIYRQILSREWLFLDVRPSVAYRREELLEEREWVPALSIGLELQFGEP